MRPLGNLPRGIAAGGAAGKACGSPREGNRRGTSRADCAESAGLSLIRRRSSRDARTGAGRKGPQRASQNIRRWDGNVENCSGAGIGTVVGYGVGEGRCGSNRDWVRRNRDGEAQVGAGTEVCEEHIAIAPTAGSVQSRLQWQMGTGGLNRKVGGVGFSCYE